MNSIAQNPLPLKTWQGKTGLPLIFYISGDGGFNKFSTNLCEDISKSGYPITAMDARTYFWTKKTPEQTATDIMLQLEKELRVSHLTHFVFVGYSFGADVMPFVVNRLSASLIEKLLSVVLLSPSNSTDFEVHLTDLFGGGSKRKFDVPKEINAMNIPKSAILFGSDENGYRKGEITLKNCSLVTLHGNHHYDGDTQKVASVVMKYF